MIPHPTLPPPVKESPLPKGPTSLYSVSEEGTCSLDLHVGQTRAWDSIKRFIFIISGTQGGKTSFGPWWLYREIMDKGAGDYFAVTSTYDLFKLKMLPELRAVFEDTLGIGRYHAGDKIMEILDPDTGEFWSDTRPGKMWARIILRSAEAKGGLESATAKAAWLDECGQDSFTIESWEAIRRRLTLFQGRVLGTTTPYNLGWLKTAIMDPFTKGDPDIDVIQFASIYNPSFPQAEFESARRTMPSWRFKMFYMGLFSRPAGMIYNDFIDQYKEEGGHKVKPFKLPSTWPRYVGVDPGAVNTALIWLAHDTQNDIFYAYRESLDGGKSTKQHAKGALGLAKKNKERVIRWYIGNKGEVQQRMDWMEAGVRPALEPPIADVEAGIDRVIGLLKEFRLYFFDDLHGTMDEIGMYSRKLDPEGKPLEEIKDKARFHRLDALRYVAASTQKIGIGFR